MSERTPKTKSKRKRRSPIGLAPEGRARGSRAHSDRRALAHGIRANTAVLETFAEARDRTDGEGST